MTETNHRDQTKTERVILTRASAFSNVVRGIASASSGVFSGRGERPSRARACCLKRRMVATEG